MKLNHRAALGTLIFLSAMAILASTSRFTAAKTEYAQSTMLDMGKATPSSKNTSRGTPLDSGYGNVDKLISRHAWLTLHPTAHVVGSKSSTKDGVEIGMWRAEIEQLRGKPIAHQRIQNSASDEALDRDLYRAYPSWAFETRGYLHRRALSIWVTYQQNKCIGTQYVYADDGDFN